MIDSHAHLGDEAFSEDRSEVIERANLAAIIDICTDEETLHTGLKLSEKYPHVHLAAATTPHDVQTDGEHFFPLVEKHADKLVAIGESGLDYHYEHSPRRLQQDYLRRYLELASSLSLPIVIHCREAFDDLFSILDSHDRLPGVLHCFTGTLDEAREVVKRGWYVSLSGIITFKKSEELRDVALETPLSQLLIETDAPYLAPTPYRGKRNEPAFVAEVAKTIATTKEIPLDEVISATTANARQLFNI